METFVDFKEQSYLSEDNIEEALRNAFVINFEITERCNLKCEYCAFGELYHQSDCRIDRDLNTDFAFNLIDHLFDVMDVKNPLNEKRVVYIGFYGGEPLIRIDIIKAIIDYVDNKNCKHLQFKYSMTSNGVLLDKHMDYLAEKKFSLLISLDGNKEHNSFRLFKNGQESYSVVTSNIQLLKDSYPEYFKSHVNFNAVIHKRNDKDAVRKFIQDTYGKRPSTPSVSTNGISECGLQKGDSVFVTEAEQVSVRDIVCYLRYEQGVIYSDYSDLLRMDYKVPDKLPTATCIPFSRRIHLCADGTILPCEKIGKEFPFGIVTKNGVQLDYSKICKIMNKLYQRVELQCSNCEKQLTCQQCILQEAKKDEVLICSEFEKKKGNIISRIESKLAKNPLYTKKIMKEYYEH